MQLTYTPDLSAFKKYIAQAEKALSRPAQEPLASGFRGAGAVYSGEMRRRFVVNARGGGEWPDLADSTKLARARGTKAGRKRFDKSRKKLSTPGMKRGEANRLVVRSMRFEILRDKGLLLNSMTQGGPQNIERFITDGITVGTAIHYARYHQDGGLRLPRRTIYVEPPAPTYERMRRLIQAAADKAISQAKTT